MCADVKMLISGSMKVWHLPTEIRCAKMMKTETHVNMMEIHATIHALRNLLHSQVIAKSHEAVLHMLASWLPCG